MALVPCGKFVIVAGGPSVTPKQIRLITKAQLERKCFVIAVNDAAYLFPLANIIHGCDKWWWEQNSIIIQFYDSAFLTTLQEPISDHIYQYKYEHRQGLDVRSDYVATGRNGGHQAINIAYHRGAIEIGLVGFDFKPGSKGEEHWFGSHKGKHIQNTLYGEWINCMNTIPKALKESGSNMKIYNCTPGSAIKCFDFLDLESFLQ